MATWYKRESGKNSSLAPGAQVSNVAHTILSPGLGRAACAGNAASEAGRFIMIWVLGLAAQNQRQQQRRVRALYNSVPTSTKQTPFLTRIAEHVGR